jgi:hypothetical protein
MFFCGIGHSIHASDTTLLCMGLFSIFFGMPGQPSLAKRVKAGCARQLRLGMPASEGLPRARPDERAFADPAFVGYMADHPRPFKNGRPLIPERTP